ncbi:MAG: nickel pincer cofactor biosynthesis protein LarC [Candidatus Latescibacterota bacterium]|nr:nickel pincer cofactor biosynthesis protein LarC [Candidatus Latescibacterota bacterium]
MIIAYFDCFSGISGDMVLGAMVDAGLDAELLRLEIDKLNLGDVRVHFSPTERHGIAATRAEVEVEGGPLAAADEQHQIAGGTNAAAGSVDHHVHRHVEEVLEVLRQSRLDEEVREKAIEIFRRLAAAEARVHGVATEEVHLHEVGTADALVDIVGAVVGLRLLGVEQVFSSPLRCGSGFVQCAHGRYPVPVPAVMELCSGVPLIQTDATSELITPTGAAIITGLAASFEPPPEFRLRSVGYGAGRRPGREIPNLLRIRIGETEGVLARDQAVLVEANIDDMNPEVYGYLFDRLLAGGARDVYVTPVHMKKGRPGSLLSVLADAVQLDRVADIVLSETTTTGLRYHYVERRKLERSSVTVATAYGPVRVKTASFDGVARHAPEYDDCARLARLKTVPILTVYEAARNAIERE